MHPDRCLVVGDTNFGLKPTSEDEWPIHRHACAKYNFKVLNNKQFQTTPTGHYYDNAFAAAAGCDTPDAERC